MTTIISSADDRQDIPDMSSYIVNTIWGLLTRLVLVTQTATKTDNYDDMRNVHPLEESEQPDERSRVTKGPAEHARADTADALYSSNIDLPKLQYLEIKNTLNPTPEGVQQLAEILSRLSSLKTLKLYLKSGVDFKPIEKQIPEKCRKIFLITNSKSV